MTQKASFFATAALVASLPTIGLADQFGRYSNDNNFIIDHPGCAGVTVVNIPFCPEECGQLQSELGLRATFLQTGAKMADSNGDGDVVAGYKAYSLNSESNPRRFGPGRNAFMARVSDQGDVDVVGTPVRQNYIINGDTPYGQAFFADTSAQLSCAMR